MCVARMSACIALEGNTHVSRLLEMWCVFLLSGDSLYRSRVRVFAVKVINVTFSQRSRMTIYNLVSRYLSV